jgi:hypothetical protein
MSIQYSTTHRSNDVTDIVTQLGATAFLLIYTGAPPANCATAATGTLLVSMPCSSTFGTVSAGLLTANAITSTAAANSGTAGYWRLCTNSGGGTVIAQGLVYASSTLNTSALTAAGSNILSFASGGGAIAVGQTVSGTNIQPGTYALATSGTSIAMNTNVLSGGVASGATITFGGDLTFTGGVAFTTGTTITVSSFTITANGA